VVVLKLAKLRFAYCFDIGFCIGFHHIYHTQFNRVYIGNSTYGGFKTRKHHELFALEFNDLVIERVGSSTPTTHLPIELHRYNYRDGDPKKPSMGKIEFNGLFVRCVCCCG
jgi:hypothetical protein